MTTIVIKKQNGSLAIESNFITIGINLSNIGSSAKTIFTLLDSIVPEKYKEELNATREQINPRLSYIQEMLSSFKGMDCTQEITIDEKNGVIHFGETKISAGSFHLAHYINAFQKLIKMDEEECKFDLYGDQPKDEEYPEHKINSPISVSHLMDILEDWNLLSSDINDYLNLLSPDKSLNYNDLVYITRRFNMENKLKLVMMENKVKLIMEEKPKPKQVIEPGIAVHEFYNKIEEKNLSTPEIVKYFQDKKSIAGRMYTNEIKSVINGFELNDHFVCGSDLED